MAGRPTKPPTPTRSSVCSGCWATSSAPGPAGLPDQRFWRIDRHADYGPLDGLARHHVNADLICEQWEDILRVAGSLSTGTVRASELLRVLQGGGRPSRLGRAIAELGRVAKTLHLLAWIDSEQLRRETGVGLNRHEGRHSVARIIFHGNEGQLRQPYRDGQEDQLGALGFALNSLVLWNANTSTTPSPSYAPPRTRSPTRISGGSRRCSMSTSRCSATSPSPCPTSSPTGTAASYASSARRLSVRSCSVTTGTPKLKAPGGIVAMDAEMQLTNTAPVQSNQRLMDELCSSCVCNGGLCRLRVLMDECG